VPAVRFPPGMLSELTSISWIQFLLELEPEYWWKRLSRLP
jgi:hypothetical protein